MTAIGIALAATMGAGVWLLAGPRPQRDDAADGRRSAPVRLLDRARGELTRAGLDRVPPAMIVVTALLVAVLVGALAYGATGVPLLALLAAAAGLVAPALLIGWRAAQRRAANRLVWPDAVDHLVSAVRAGLSLPEAVAALAETGPEATRPEFAAFAATYRRTGAFRLALDELKGRLADPTADRIIETLRLSREVGGAELATILRSLAVYLREEQAIRHEVEARQSWVMNAARLGVVAPWVVLVLLATRPEAGRAYDTPEGSALILAGLAVTALAYAIMRRIGRLRDDRRWFA